MENSESIHIAAVRGSLRGESFTARVLDHAVAVLREDVRVRVDLIDPARLNLAFPGGPGADALESELVRRVAAADGVLFATPEYHGSFSSVVKVLIDNMGYPSALAGKPVALLGVATGRIGAVKALEHLRSVCSHVGAIVLPYPVSVALVESAFDAGGHFVDADLEVQVRSLLHALVRYVEGERRGRAGGTTERPSATS